MPFNGIKKPLREEFTEMLPYNTVNDRFVSLFPQG